MYRSASTDADGVPNLNRTRTSKKKSRFIKDSGRMNKLYVQIMGLSLNLKLNREFAMRADLGNESYSLDPGSSMLSGKAHVAQKIVQVWKSETTTVYG